MINALTATATPSIATTIERLKQENSISPTPVAEQAPDWLSA
jgi:hypothetical protein